MLALECRTEVRGFRHGAATFCRAVLAGDKPKRKKEKGVRRDEKDRRERVSERERVRERRGRCGKTV